MSFVDIFQLVFGFLQVVGVGVLGYLGKKVLAEKDVKIAIGANTTTLADNEIRNIGSYAAALADTTAKVVSQYENLVKITSDYTHQITNLSVSHAKIEADNKYVRDENFKLKAQIMELRKENNALRAELDETKRNISKLESELEKLNSLISHKTE